MRIAGCDAPSGVCEASDATEAREDQSWVLERRDDRPSGSVDGDSAVEGNSTRRDKPKRKGS